MDRFFYGTRAAEGLRCLLDELGIIGWLRFYKAFDHALEPDRHQGEYEIH